MPKPLRKPVDLSSAYRRAVVFRGRRTSLSLEHEFWDAVKDLAHLQGKTINTLIEEIDLRREGINLSSAIRLPLLAEERAGRLPFLNDK